MRVTAKSGRRKLRSCKHWWCGLQQKWKGAIEEVV